MGETKKGRAGGSAPKIEDLLPHLGDDKLQEIIGEFDARPSLSEADASNLRALKNEALARQGGVGEAKLGPSRLTKFGERGEAVPDNNAMVAAAPPRSDQPLAEPATYKGQSQPDEPRSAAQLLSGGDAGGLAIPTDTPQTQRNPMAGDINVSENNATYDALARSQQPPPPSGNGGAGDALAGINLNAPEVRTNTQTSQAIEGAGVKSEFAKADAALQRQQAAEQQRAQHLAQAGADKANMQQGYADQLKAGNDAYQAKVQARQEQVAGVERERAAASQAYQDEVKNAPLGTMLNPTAAQAMGSAIAQALGAFGAGMSHSPNAALAILDKQLDAAQQERKVRIEGKAFGVRMADRHLQDLRDIFHDDDAAHLAWKADQFDLFSARLEKQATLTGNQDIIDKAAVGAEEAQAKAANLRAQALQKYDRVVQSQTSTESGPKIAIAAAKAKFDALKASQGGKDITVDFHSTFEPMMNLTLAQRELAQHVKAGNLPSAIRRVTAAYGSSFDSWTKAAAGGFANANLSPEEKNAIQSGFSFLNAGIKDQTGLAVRGGEEGRIKQEYGFADFSSPSDVMNGIRRIGQRLAVKRASIIAANPQYGQVFQAADQAAEQTPGAFNATKTYGTVAGQ